MDGNIQPANIFAALFLTQVLLSGIVIVAAILLQDSDALWPIVAMVGLAAAALTLSEFLVVLWRPVFGGLWVPSLGLGVTRAFVFLVDIVGLFFLVVLSGGSRNSPFAFLFFILPALAIFLRESLWLLIVYCILTLIAFYVGLYRDPAFFKSLDPLSGKKTLPKVRMMTQQERAAYLWVACSSFVLTTVIGYITRPR